MILFLQSTTPVIIPAFYSFEFIEKGETLIMLNPCRPQGLKELI